MSELLLMGTKNPISLRESCHFFIVLFRGIPLRVNLETPPPGDCASVSVFFGFVFSF